MEREGAVVVYLECRAVARELGAPDFKAAVKDEMGGYAHDDYEAWAQAARTVVEIRKECHAYAVACEAWLRLAGEDDTLWQRPHLWQPERYPRFWVDLDMVLAAHEGLGPPGVPARGEYRGYIAFINSACKQVLKAMEKA